jgi:hypothetical protein
MNDAFLNELSPSPPDAHERNNVLLFLGSGVSYDSGMPSVEQLTDKILNIDPANLGSLHHFCRLTSALNYKRVSGAQALLSQMVEYCHPLGLTEVNYEDLYSLCLKIEHTQYAPRVDPTSRSLLDFVYEKLTDTEYFRICDNSIQEAAMNARLMIEYTVKQELFHPKRSPKSLENLQSYIELIGPKNIDIITLNHDTLVEEFLGGADYWTDGFERNESSPRGNEYDPLDFFMENEAFADPKKVRILKPHGSCNWFQYRVNDTNKWVACRRNYEPIFRGENGNHFTENPFTSGILSGSFTKERSYSLWYTGVMFRNAYRILHEYDRVICSGYGWKDFGINEMFIEWIQRNPQKRILILENSKSNNFTTVKSLVNQWTASYSGKTEIHPQWFSETDPALALEKLKVVPSETP